MRHRQIDYVTINQKYRNNVKHAWAIQGWGGNIQQLRQRAAVLMDITINLLQN